MGSLKLLGDRILTFDKVRRTDRKVFHSKYWHGPQSTCMLFYFLTYLDVFREEEKKPDKLVMSCRFFSVTTTLWYPQIGMGSYWRGSLPKKYYTDLNITFHKKISLFNIHSMKMDQITIQLVFFGLFTIKSWSKVNKSENLKLKKRVMTNSELHDSGFHFAFARDFLVKNWKCYLFIILSFCKT